jgi:hypothetical protein
VNRVAIRMRKRMAPKNLSGVSRCLPYESNSPGQGREFDRHRHGAACVSCCVVCALRRSHIAWDPARRAICRPSSTDLSCRT